MNKQVITTYMETSKSSLSLFGSMKQAEQAAKLIAVTLLVMRKAKFTKKGNHMNVVRKEVSKFLKAFGWKGKKLLRAKDLKLNLL